jgi:transposase
MKVFIGVDSHKLSVTIEVVDDHETVLSTGRFSTDRAGYAAMLKHVAAWPDRVWAVEGSNGAERPLAQRLLADGEQVVDVPAKLAARARLSTPATTARPMPTMRTRLRWSRSAPRGCGCCPTTSS